MRKAALSGLVLVVAACSGVDETVTPTPTCPSAGPPSGWPSEPGILRIDAPPPALPFATAEHRPFPALEVAEPIVLRQPKIVTIVAAGDPLADQLFAFSDAVATSAWWRAVAGEYDVQPPVRSVHVLGPPQPGPMGTKDLIAYVHGAVASAGSDHPGPRPGAGSDAAPDGRAIFLVHLSPGIEFVSSRNQQNCGCAFASGAHFRLGSGTHDAMAYVQRCSATDVDAVTQTASHELLEAATNPLLKGGFGLSAGDEPWKGTVWALFQSGPNELADRCTGTRVHEGAWEYQRSWSNLAALAGGDPCAPAVPEPYFNVTVDKDWYPIAPGGTVEVEVRGWSTGPRDDWFVYPRLASGTQTGFKAELWSDESASTGSATFYGINNGKTAKLRVTAPDAPKGSYAVVRLLSRPSSPANDLYHFWPVGFYVE